jgi:Rieske 2Fe-2S family protein
MDQATGDTVMAPPRTLTSVSGVKAFRATREELQRARHLPGYVYTSPEFEEYEKDRIFMRDWLCIGRVEEMRLPGDYMAIRIMGEPVLVVRDAENNLNAFSNVCRHRGVEVAQGSGNAKEFLCPYHSWAYDLKGKLTAAPYMRDSSVDLSTCRLPQLKTDIYRGWLFLTFNANPTPLSEVMAEFDGEFGFFRPEDCLLADKTVIDLDCNWKFVIENLMDIYHVGVVHGRTFGQRYQGDQERYKFKLMARGVYSFFFEAAPLTKDGKSLFGKMPWLQDKPESLACLGFMSPNMNFAARCDVFRHWVTWPISPSKCRLISYTLLPAETFRQPGFEEKLREYIDFLKVTIEEDREMVQSLQNGVGSRNFDPGPLSKLEGPIHHIINNYLDEMTA